MRMMSCPAGRDSLVPVDQGRMADEPQLKAIFETQLAQQAA